MRSRLCVTRAAEPVRIFSGRAERQREPQNDACEECARAIRWLVALLELSHQRCAFGFVGHPVHKPKILGQVGTRPVWDKEEDEDRLLCGSFCGGHNHCLPDSLDLEILARSSSCRNPIADTASRFFRPISTIQSFLFHKTVSSQSNSTRRLCSPGT